MTGIRKFVVLLLSALALVSILFSAEMLYRERNQIKNAYGDFIIFYTGAQILRDGKGRDLYDLSVQNSYQSKFNVPIRVGPLPLGSLAIMGFALLIAVELVRASRQTLAVNNPA